MVGGRHLFLDDKGIAQRRNVDLCVNRPQKIGPVIEQDRLWRSRLTGYYGQVLEADGLLHLYTNCGWGDLEQFPDAPAYWGLLYGKQRYVQHLTSLDGLHWHTPSHGVLEIAGSRDNNAVYADCMEGSFVCDPKAAPRERWKYLHAQNTPQGQGIRLSVSPDGLRFEDTDRVMFRVMGDSQNVCYFDPSLGRYVLYFRSYTAKPGHPDHGRFFAFSGPEHAERSVARVTFEHWEELNGLAMPERNVLEPDEQDPDRLDIYTNAAVRYPLAEDVTLAFPAVYQKFPPETGGAKGVIGRNNGVLAPQFAYSRDGERFTRVRAPYVFADPVGGTDSASNYFYAGMALRPDCILQYCWGGNYTHGGDARYASPEPWHRNAVFAYKQRIDGFCSMDFAYAGGLLITEPVLWRKATLHLNADIAAWGLLEISLLDAWGQEIPDARATLRGNCLDIAALRRPQDAGRALRLRFEGRGAKLYSYWFE